MKASTFLAHLAADKHMQPRIAHVAHLPRHAARYARLSRTLHPKLLKALGARGIEKFYTHQAHAIDLVRAGHAVLIATGTASGKTLCYNVPVLDAILRDTRTRALYLFPTKALAQDQADELRQLTKETGHWRPDTKQSVSGLQALMATYDGDTPADERATIRHHANIVLTNPDMLSVGILPNHHLWQTFLRHLRFVVLDEAHAYRGVFGSQVACVLRRLLRLCAQYGSQPQLILCSATIANPDEHAQRLTGRAVNIISDDGAPRGAKEFVLWNPPLVERARTRRSSAQRYSATSEGALLFAAMVSAGVRTLAFTRTRRAAETILNDARERLRRDQPQLADSIRAYRAGYRADERRAVEQALFNGQLRGVVATNALELGVDIGSLDATLLVGYPGSIASLWQQAGRAGRGTNDTLTIMIAEDNPLDQFFISYPDALFAQPIEHALIHPDNPYVLAKQLPCAAFESPLTNADEALFGAGFVDAMIALERADIVRYADDQWTYQGDAQYPAQHVSLRSASARSVKIVLERQRSVVIEEIDAATATLRAHDGAIYLSQGETYLITRLDLRAGMAYARVVDAAYVTEPRVANSVHIAHVRHARKVGAARAYLGAVRVSERVVGYRRRPIGGDDKLVDVDLDYPPQTFETVALWWDIPIATLRAVERARRDVQGSLHAVEHGCASLLPLFAMCDRTDIGALSTLNHADTGKPQIFLYDAHEGGIGISEKGFAILESLWRAALARIEQCGCADGCPSCIQSARCGSNNERLDKQGAIVLLGSLLK